MSNEETSEDFSEGSDESTTDFEAALITSVVDAKDIRTPIKRKVTKEFFFNTVTKAVWTWLVEWYENPLYPDTPSWESLMASFPHFEKTYVDESVLVLCDHVRSRKLYSDIAAAMEVVVEATNGNPVEGLDELRKQTAKVSSAHTVDVALDTASQMDSLIDDYTKMSTGERTLKGRSYGMPTLDEATMGAQGGQLIIVYGRPKTKKTWFALRLLRSLTEHGNDGHIFSQELSLPEIFRRYVAIYTGCHYGQFLRGTLPVDEEERFFDSLETMRENNPALFDQCEAAGEGSLIEIKTKLEESRAKVVLIDGAHNLGTWKELYAIIKGLKRIAKQLDVVVILTTHAKRGAKDAEGGDDFAHSDAFLQECDLAIRLTADADNLKNREIVAETTAIREGTPCKFIVNSHLCRNFTEKSRVFLDEGADTGGAESGEGGDFEDEDDEDDL